MSLSYASPQTPPTTPKRVTFQLNPCSDEKMNQVLRRRTFLTNLELPRGEVFLNNLIKILTKRNYADKRTKDAVLEEVSDFVLQNGEQKCKDVNRTCIPVDVIYKYGQDMCEMMNGLPFQSLSKRVF